MAARRLRTPHCGGDPREVPHLARHGLSRSAASGARSLAFPRSEGARCDGINIGGLAWQPCVHAQRTGLPVLHFPCARPLRDGPACLIPITDCRHELRNFVVCPPSVRMAPAMRHVRGARYRPEMVARLYIVI